ncbi:hypothetical protein [Silanimonas sp.]|uniref:hypothetical protein n=1 Tax=Silanimonas sp. TaxID=1929290 RepID=UPI0022C3E232|nr:hypothetical protein [Silanimonas sp.]MCZ8113839.1 hypothetical protein [Silanimonas sp.]
MKHIGKAMAEAIGSIPSTPKSVKDMARLSRIAGEAYEIATYHPVSDWREKIADAPADIREEVREYLADMYRSRQRDAALKARVDSGVDVVIEIRDSGKAA